MILTHAEIDRLRGQLDSAEDKSGTARAHQEAYSEWIDAIDDAAPALLDLAAECLKRREAEEMSARAGGRLALKPGEGYAALDRAAALLGDLPSTRRGVLAAWAVTNQPVWDAEPVEGVAYHTHKGVAVWVGTCFARIDTAGSYTFGTATAGRGPRGFLRCVRPTEWPGGSDA